MSVICPKCGSLGTPRVRTVYSYSNGRKYKYRYLYIDHGGGKHRKLCYIGPVEGYVHAETLHELGLTNILEQDYIDVSIQSIIKAAERLSKESRKSIEESEEIVLRRLFKYLLDHETHRVVLKKILKEYIKDICGENR